MKTVNSKKMNKGYSLIEMLISLALFSIVVMIAISGLALITDANRRAEATRRIIDNLDFIVEDMVRTTRQGNRYHCGDFSDYDAEVTTGQSGIGSSRNCVDGDYLAFEASGGDNTDPSDQVVYRFNGGIIEKITDPINGSFVQVSDPQIEIQKLKFYVTGSQSNDNTPARVLVILKAVTGREGTSDRTVFNLQTTITQRGTDL
ncbi:MAG: type II secretion system protein [Candidatus Pacebacteria bacterium]|nr:type II secretion system protein [Candidatus Paceibacterota bacterium]